MGGCGMVECGVATWGAMTDSRLASVVTDPVLLSGTDTPTVVASPLSSTAPFELAISRAHDGTSSFVSRRWRELEVR